MLKHRLLFVVFILLSVISKGQSIERDETDKFTNVRSLVTTTHTIDDYLLEVYGSRHGSLYALTFIFEAFQVVSVGRDSEATFLLKSGSKIRKPYEAKYKIISKGERVYFGLFMTKAELKKLQDDPVTDIRIETSDRSTDYTVEEKAMNIIPTIAKLLLETK